MFGSWNPSQYKRITSASVFVKKATGLAAITGILCATSSSQIVQIWDTPTDDTDNKAVQVTGSLTLVAGTPYPIPAKINYGIYVKLVSGSGDSTIFYD